MAHKMMVNPIESVCTGSYSPAIRAGELVFVSGQGPLDPATGDVVGDTIAEQTEQTMRNLADVLQTAGLSLNDCVKVNVYLADLADYDAFDAAYRAWFRDPLPARTTVGAALPKGVVEIDVTAMHGAAT